MKKLRSLREERNLTMKALGNELGVAESTISLYETGKREPDYETLKRIAGFFGVSTDYLLDLTNDQTINRKTGQLPHNLDSKSFSDFSILIQNLGYSTRFIGTDELRFEIKKDGTSVWFPISEKNMDSIVHACLNLMDTILEDAVQRMQKQVDEVRKCVFSEPDKDGLVPQDVPEIKAAMDELGRQLLLEKKAADESEVSAPEKLA